MRLQRWAAAALTALLALGAACAQADSEGRIVQTSCSIVRSDDYYLVYCFAQVHNDSDEVICLEQGTFELHDGEQSLFTGEVSRLWPSFLAPGEDGYYFDVATFAPDESGNAVMPAVSGIDYNVVYTTMDESYASCDLSAVSTVEQDEAGHIAVLCELTNGTDMTAFEPTVTFGLYTDGGSMIYADGRTIQGVGIPAGDSLVVRFLVDRVFVEQWKQYGVTIAEARVSAAFRADDD